ncbi:hypothetical protein K2Q16_02245 [Patescibacteria group bacterium]|nr:hypothetical protein [Patescibacteria group bacterium]
MKNIITIIGLLVVAAAGIYLFTQRDAANLVLNDSVDVSSSVLASTQVFIERWVVLESLTIEPEIFEDPRFTSLESYTTPVPARPVGRTNPFEPAVSTGL